MTWINVVNPPVIYISENEDELGEQCKLAELRFHLNPEGMVTVGYIINYRNKTKKTKVFRYFYMNFLKGAYTIKNTFPEPMVIPPNKDMEVTYDLAWTSNDVSPNEYKL